MAKILIIDDEDSIRKMLTALFERENYIVKDACDGKEGIQIASTFNPDVIITDMLMPEKEGVETIQEIRRVDSEVKIIAISGGGVVQPEMYLKLARKMGADLSFTKPVDTVTLLKSVERLLGE